MPSWSDLLAGVRPPQVPVDEIIDRCDFEKGWQHSAASVRDSFFRDALMSNLDRSHRAMLRSQSGPCAGRVLSVLPLSPECTIRNAHMRLILLRRLRLKMPLGPRKCKCGRRLDRHGDHRVGCSNAGVLTKRSRPLEKALARVCREAGGRVAENAKLRDMNLRSIRANDARCIEVLASGLPLFSGSS